MKRKLLIVACARSGTRYISHVWRQVGLDVQHEATGADGTSSWYFAAPNSDLVPPPHKVWENGKHRHYDGIKRQDVLYEHVFHQIRHPLKTMGSVIKIVGAPDWEYVRHHLKIALPKSRLGKAAIYWLRWNALCESVAEYSYRVEDIDRVWSRMLSTVDLPPRVVPPVSRTLHSQHGYRKAEVVTWADVIRFSPVIAAQCQRQAARYGYEV